MMIIPEIRGFPGSERLWRLVDGQALAALFQGKKNVVLLGEAGCGKSEIAINLAVYLASSGEKPVHFFDLDQTKPLFRSRDVAQMLQERGVTLHYQDQLLDAPTLVGGVTQSLLAQDRYTILDVGGNDTGARMIGGFAQILNREDCLILYVVNPYRPWSRDILAIDGTMSAILRVSRLKSFRLLGNPNLGPDTTAEEFLEGCRQLAEMLSPYATVHGACVEQSLYPQVQSLAGMPLFPLRLYLTYPWSQGMAHS